MRNGVIALLCCSLGAASSAAAELPELVFVPAAPTDSEVVRAVVLSDGSGGCAPYFYATVDHAAARVSLVGFDYGPPGCPQGAWTSQVVVGHLTPGDWTVEAAIDNVPYASTTLTVAASPTLVTLGSFKYFGTNFRAEVEWVDPRTGESRLAPGVALSNRSAQFWFFEPDNPEITLKVLDGTAINAHHWLFVSSMTGVEFTLRIKACVEGDPPFCDAAKEYYSPAGANLDVVDVRAFQ